MNFSVQKILPVTDLETLIYPNDSEMPVGAVPQHNNASLRPFIKFNPSFIVFLKLAKFSMNWSAGKTTIKVSGFKFIAARPMALAVFLPKGSIEMDGKKHEGPALKQPLRCYGCLIGSINMGGLILERDIRLF